MPFIILLLIALLCGAWTHGVAPAPVSQTVTPSAIQGAPVIGTALWRDQEVTTGWFTKGEIDLRTGFTNSGGYMPGGNGIFMDIGVAGGAPLRLGIISGGIKDASYTQFNPASCIPNWPTSGAHTFTFGVRGLQVYFKIDGVVAEDTCQTSAAANNPNGLLQYTEFRPGTVDANPAAIWVVSGGSGTATINYFTYTHLYSSIAGSGDGSHTITAEPGTFYDPRDFGLRDIGACGGCSSAVTGSMSQGSNIVTLSAPADFRIGDVAIVEIGGEAGGGAIGTDGVGGNSPILNYANLAAMNADTSQPNGTMAYLLSPAGHPTYTSTGGVWTQTTAPCGLNFGNCSTASGITAYYYEAQPQSLVAFVTAVNASPATQLTLTLPSGSAANAFVATTNANVYLDSAPSFAPFNVNTAEAWGLPENGYFILSGLTFIMPAGTWHTSGSSSIYSGGSLTDSDRPNVTVYGQGVNNTTYVQAKGTEMGLMTSTLNSPLVWHDFSYVGNMCDVFCSPYGYTGANRNLTFWPGSLVTLTGGASISAYNINCTNVFGCISLTGSVATINNVNVNNINIVRGYSGWMVQLVDCSSGSKITNSTVNGTYLNKAFEMFACNGASIVHSAGTNDLYSTNSSSNWTIDFDTIGGSYDGLQDIITANAWGDPSTDPTEAIFNINTNAFGSGNTGTINNPSVVEQGYMDSSSLHGRNGFNNNLEFWKTAANQHNITIQGQYPGVTACATNLGGYLQASNYDPNAGEPGPVGVMNSGSSIDNVATGIRIVGTAAGIWGNLTSDNHNGSNDATATITNNVVDVIQPGGTQSGNETNNTFCGSPAPSLVQKGVSQSGSSTTSQATTLTGTAAGNLIIVGVTWCTHSGSPCVNTGTATSVSSVVSSAGDTCAQAPSAAGNNGSKLQSDIWYCNNIVGGNDTITANMSATSSFVAVALSEWHGANASAPLDPGTGNNATGATTGPINITTGAPTSTTNEVIYTTTIAEGAISQNPAQQGVNVSASGGFWDSFQYAPTLGSYTSAWDYASTQPSVLSIAAFKQ